MLNSTPLRYSSSNGFKQPRAFSPHSNGCELNLREMCLMEQPLRFRQPKSTLLLCLISISISLSSCKSIATPNGGETRTEARSDEDFSSFLERIPNTDLEIRRRHAEKSAKPTARMLTSRAKYVNESIAAARHRCMETEFGWLDIDVDILSGPCKPDCVAASFLRDNRFRNWTRRFIHREFKEKYSHKQPILDPDSLRSTFVVRVAFARNGRAVDSSVKLEEERGEYENGMWFTRLATEAEIDPIAERCEVRATFNVNVAHFTSGPAGP